MASVPQETQCPLCYGVFHNDIIAYHCAHCNGEPQERPPSEARIGSAPTKQPKLSAFFAAPPLDNSKRSEQTGPAGPSMASAISRVAVLGGGCEDDRSGGANVGGGGNENNDGDDDDDDNFDELDTIDLEAIENLERSCGNVATALSSPPKPMLSIAHPPGTGPRHSKAQESPGFKKLRAEHLESFSSPANPLTGWAPGEKKISPRHRSGFAADGQAPPYSSVLSPTEQSSLPRRGKEPSRSPLPETTERETCADLFDDRISQPGVAGPAFDSSKGSDWIYPSNMVERMYQVNMVTKALFKNTLVCLPTGLGKTMIAAVVMYNFYRWFPTGKVVFMAPTKPLVNQQLDACFNMMGFAREDVAELTGSTNAEIRAKKWKDRRVFFLTPQTMQNDLTRGSCPSGDLVCMVFDEAHKTQGEAAYAQVAKYVGKTNVHCRILALSATPGENAAAVQSLITTLNIAHIEIRSENSIDVCKYLNSRVSTTCVLELGPELTDLQRRFHGIMQPYLVRLKQCGGIYTATVENVSQFMLMKARDGFLRDSNAMARVNVGRAKQDFNTLISLVHVLKMLVQYGKSTAFKTMLSDGDTTGAPTVGRSDITVKKSLKYVYERESDFKAIFHELADYANSTENVSSASNFGHPKLQKVEQAVSEHFQKVGKDTRVIVFSGLRHSVDDIVEVLSTNPLITPSKFVGQTGSGKGGKGGGLKQKEQIEIINQFKAGGFNTLVATQVGEEGLDIGEVDLIVFFDASASSTRLVQRTGRTGRKRSGAVLMLMMKGKEEDAYHKGISTQKRMTKAVIEGAKNFVMSPNSLRMVPMEWSPQMRKIAVDSTRNKLTKATRGPARGGTAKKASRASAYLTGSQEVQYRTELQASQPSQIPSLHVNRWMSRQSVADPVRIATHSYRTTVMINVLRLIADFNLNGVVARDPARTWYENYPKKIGHTAPEARGAITNTLHADKKIKGAQMTTVAACDIYTLEDVYRMDDDSNDDDLVAVSLGTGTSANMNSDVATESSTARAGSPSEHCVSKRRGDDDLGLQDANYDLAETPLDARPESPALAPMVPVADAVSCDHYTQKVTDDQPGMSVVDMRGDETKRVERVYSETHHWGQRGLHTALFPRKELAVPPPPTESEFAKIALKLGFTLPPDMDLGSDVEVAKQAASPAPAQGTTSAENDVRSAVMSEASAAEALPADSKTLNNAEKGSTPDASQRYRTEARDTKGDVFDDDDAALAEAIENSLLDAYPSCGDTASECKAPDAHDLILSDTRSDTYRKGKGCIRSSTSSGFCGVSVASTQRDTRCCLSPAESESRGVKDALDFAFMPDPDDCVPLNPVGPVRELPERSKPPVQGRFGAGTSHEDTAGATTPPEGRIGSPISASPFKPASIATGLSVPVSLPRVGEDSSESPVSHRFSGAEGNVTVTPGAPASFKIPEDNAQMRRKPQVAADRPPVHASPMYKNSSPGHDASSANGVTGGSGAPCIGVSDNEDDDDESPVIIRGGRKRAAVVLSQDSQPLPRPEFAVPSLPQKSPTNRLIRRMSSSESATSAADSQYVVDALIDTRVVGGSRQWRIRWEGYGAGEDTWKDEVLLRHECDFEKLRSELPPSLASKVTQSSHSSRHASARDLAEQDCDCEAAGGSPKRRKRKASAIKRNKFLDSGTKVSKHTIVSSDEDEAALGIHGDSDYGDTQGSFIDDDVADSQSSRRGSLLSRTSSAPSPGQMMAIYQTSLVSPERIMGRRAMFVGGANKLVFGARTPPQTPGDGSSFDDRGFECDTAAAAKPGRRRTLSDEEEEASDVDSTDEDGSDGSDHVSDDGGNYRDEASRGDARLHSVDARAARKCVPQWKDIDLERHAEFLEAKYGGGSSSKGRTHPTLDSQDTYVDGSQDSFIDDAPQERSNRCKRKKRRLHSATASSDAKQPTAGVNDGMSDRTTKSCLTSSSALCKGGRQVEPLTTTTGNTAGKGVRPTAAPAKLALEPPSLCDSGSKQHTVAIHPQQVRHEHTKTDHTSAATMKACDAEGCSEILGTGLASPTDARQQIKNSAAGTNDVRRSSGARRPKVIYVDQSIVQQGADILGTLRAAGYHVAVDKLGASQIIVSTRTAVERVTQKELMKLGSDKFDRRRPRLAKLREQFQRAFVIIERDRPDKEARLSKELPPLHGSCTGNQRYLQYVKSLADMKLIVVFTESVDESAAFLMQLAVREAEKGWGLRREWSTPLSSSGRVLVDVLMNAPGIDYCTARRVVALKPTAREVFATIAVGLPYFVKTCGNHSNVGAPGAVDRTKAESIFTYVMSTFGKS